MAELLVRGIASIKIGDIETDGGMGTTLASLGSTYKDSASFIQEDATTSDWFSEEADDPIDTDETPGKRIMKWSIVDFTASTLIKIFGGTEESGMWLAPDSSSGVEKSVEVKSRKSSKIEVTRMQLVPKFNIPLARGEMGRVDITGTVLKPTKSGEKAVRIGPYT